MKGAIIITLLILAFTSGFVIRDVLLDFTVTTNEFPYMTVINPLNTEKISPQDFIQENQIQLYDDKIVINVPGAQISEFANTNSMDPELDDGANGIEVPIACSDVRKGDIIVYEPSWTDNLVVHRVVNIDSDEKGIYFTLKGDNSQIQDPGKVRCDQIKSLVIGVLY